MAGATSLSSWVCALKRTLDDLGIDGAGLMAHAGMDTRLLSDPLARYPVGQVVALWQCALHESQDPMLGLKVARRIAPSTFHALGYALLASAHLQEMFERLTRYFRLVSDIGDMRFERLADGSGQLVLIDRAGLITPEVAPVAWCAIDAYLLVLVNACRVVYGKGFAPQALLMQRPAPPEPAVYEEAFRCQPQYGSPSNAIVLDAATLLRPLAHANPDLARWNEEAVGRYVSGLADPAQGCLPRIRQLLRERLPSGDPTLQELADHLALSVRSLQRKLGDEGTTYRDLLNSTRQQLAQEYLRDRRYSISEIAFMLGFAEVSAFTRAFRRWQQLSPSEWREQSLRA